MGLVRGELGKQEDEEISLPLIIATRIFNFRWPYLLADSVSSCSPDAFTFGHQKRGQRRSKGKEIWTWEIFLFDTSLLRTNPKGRFKDVKRWAIFFRRNIEHWKERKVQNESMDKMASNRIRGQLEKYNKDRAWVSTQRKW